VLNVRKNTTLSESIEQLPTEFSFTASPNPFNPTVNLRVGIPGGINKSMIVQVYSISGKLMNSWNIGGAGYHVVRWDGKDANGNSLPTGLYVARLYGGSKTIQRKLLMVK
jgi:hypothetical protein